MRDALIKAMYEWDNQIAPDDMEGARLIYGAKVDCLLDAMQQDSQPKPVFREKAKGTMNMIWQLTVEFEAPATVNMDALTEAAKRVVDADDIGTYRGSFIRAVQT